MNLPDNLPIKVEHYHAGLIPEIIQNVHVNFVMSQTNVVFAAVAVGMSVDVLIHGTLLNKLFKCHITKKNIPR